MTNEKHDDRARSMLGLTPRKVRYALLILALAEAPVLLQLCNLDGSYLFFAFGLAWAAALYRLVDPKPRAVPLGLAVYATAALVSLPLLVGLMTILPRARSVMPPGLPRTFLSSTSVGFREELCKTAVLLPLVWLGPRLKPAVSSREGMIYGVMAGLAFASMENLETFHKMAHLDELTAAHGIDAAMAFTVAAALSRLVLTPLAHACWSGSVGFALTAPGRSPGRRLALGAAALAGVSTVHGLYDACATLGNRVGLGVLLALSFGFLLLLVGRTEQRGEPAGEEPALMAPQPLGASRLAWPIALAAGALVLAGWSLAHFSLAGI